MNFIAFGLGVGSISAIFGMAQDPDAKPQRRKGTQ
jgi:hypothetical protein